jgi:hypothetical protein
VSLNIPHISRNEYFAGTVVDLSSETVTNICNVYNYRSEYLLKKNPVLHFHDLIFKRFIINYLTSKYFFWRWIFHRSTTPNVLDWPFKFSFIEVATAWPVKFASDVSLIVLNKFFDCIFII